jgi:hypothetical protein
MRTNVAHRSAILLAIIVTGLAATDGVVKGLRLPLLDAEGRPTRVFTAGEGSGTIDNPKLRQATIEFFAPEKTDGPSIGRLTLDAATWFRAKDLIVGEGTLRLEGPRGTATGEGYTYDMARNELHVRHGFRLEHQEATVTGNEADLTLTVDDGTLRILAFEVRGDVVVVPTDKTKRLYQRVRGDKATYDASDHLLHIAPPLWGVDEKGHEARIDLKEMTFRLGL